MNLHVVPHLGPIGVIKYFHYGISFLISIWFNLVISKLLLASAYPGEKDPNAHKLLTRKIFDVGVQVIVNLLEIEESKSFTPYQDNFLEYARQGIEIHWIYSDLLHLEENNVLFISAIEQW